QIESPLDHEPEIPDRKILHLWEDGINFCLLDAEPTCECCRVLVHGRRRYPPSASIGIVRPPQLQSGKGGAVGTSDAIEITAHDRATHHKMMIPPRMIGPDSARGPRRLKGASKIGKRERDHLPFDLQFNGRIIKRLHRLTDLR